MSNEATDQEQAQEVFRAVVGFFEDRAFDYAVGGGLATDHWTGGEMRIADIDLVIRDDDAPAILEQLEAEGYDVVEMESSWLHKAFKDGVTIDLMFELKNGTRFDDRFRDHRRRAELLGDMVDVMAPEDQVASLAATVDRETVGQHWFRMVDIMAKNDLEWDYLVSRSSQIPLRMLSVVCFALSERVPVRKGVIDQLRELAGSSGH